MQNNNIYLTLKYSQSEIDTFQILLQTIALGNLNQLREQMQALNLSELSRFKQFRNDLLVAKGTSNPLKAQNTARV